MPLTLTAGAPTPPSAIMLRSAGEGCCSFLAQHLVFAAQTPKMTSPITSNGRMTNKPMTMTMDIPPSSAPSVGAESFVACGASTDVEAVPGGAPVPDDAAEPDDLRVLDGLSLTCAFKDAAYALA